MVPREEYVERHSKVSNFELVGDFAGRALTGLKEMPSSVYEGYFNSDFNKLNKNPDGILDGFNRFNKYFLGLTTVATPIILYNNLDSFETIEKITTSLMSIPTAFLSIVTVGSIMPFLTNWSASKYRETRKNIRNLREKLREQKQEKSGQIYDQAEQFENLKDEDFYRRLT